MDSNGRARRAGGRRDAGGGACSRVDTGGRAQGRLQIPDDPRGRQDPGTPSGSGKSTSISGTESCTWKAKKKGTGGLKGQPLQLEVGLATGAEAVAEYQQE
ncbi:MAG TPA: hypothetical protein VKB11_05625, partial [Acidimicrobiia bacterium]|nr:hypothetical protein [Acidimicrobiia bacterium]